MAGWDLFSAKDKSSPWTAAEWNQLGSIAFYFFLLPESGLNAREMVFSVWTQMFISADLCCSEFYLLALLAKFKMVMYPSLSTGSIKACVIKNEDLNYFYF